MSKFRSTILIVGLLLIAVAAALLTVLVLYATGAIVTDPIELVYSVDNAEKVYDGTPLTGESYRLESGEILEGHTADVKIIGSQTNAGTSEATVEVKIFDKNGFDVSKEYAVKVNVGTLTVSKQNLTVTVRDTEVYYSGNEVYFNDFETEGQLAPGHRLAGLNATLLNVGDSLPKDVTPLVYDAFGSEMTDNYNIALDIGEVKVVARPVSIKPKSLTKVYDGKEITATEYEITDGTLVTGQTAVVKIVDDTGYAATSVVPSEKHILIDETLFKILADDGITDVTANYDISFSTALLKIEKRPLTIRTPSDAFIFSGEENYNDKIEISGEFAPGQSIYLKGSTKVTDVTQESVKNEIEYEIRANGVDVSSYYDITWSYGTLTVKPMTIIVYSNSYEKVYDGKKLGEIIGKDGYFTTYPELPEKFTLTATVSNDVLNIVKVASGTYSFTSVSIKIGSKECIGNFNYTVRDGAYSITPKPVTINLNDFEDENKYVYGNQFELTLSDALNQDELTEYGLTVNDFTLKLPSEGIASAGLHTYGVNFIRSDKDNYALTVTDGTVLVAKKQVTLIQRVETKLSMAYNGVDGLYSANFEELNLGIYNQTAYTITAADLSVTFSIGDSLATSKQVITVNSVKVSLNGEDITDNLDIECDGVEIDVAIEQRRIITFTYSPYFYYEDEYIDYQALAGGVSYSGLADGDNLYDIEIYNTDSYYGVDGFTVTAYNGKDVGFFYTWDDDVRGSITMLNNP